MPKGVYKRSPEAKTNVGPAGRGSRVLLEPVPEIPAEDTSRVYVCTARPLRVGAYLLREGVEVPGAANWLRLDSWVNSRRVRKIKVDESYLTWDDFVAEQAQEEQATLAQLALEAQPKE